MHILVTGATGFTGSHLVKRLASEGHKVRCLVRPADDIRNKLSVEKAVAGVDVIFNLAAVFRTWGLPDKVYYDTHVEGTRNLLEAGLKNNVKRFIHCSTIGVHGSIENPPADEESPFNPGDIYQRTKLEAERLVMRYPLPAVVIRPAGIYGPGDMRFLKLFRAVARKRFIMIGNGNTLWHPVYIDDLITGFILAMTAPDIEGEAFIIGGPEYLTLNELVGYIADSLGAPHPRIYVPAAPIQFAGSFCESICRPFGIRPPLFRSRVDFFTKTRAFKITKAKEVLGYMPGYDIITGIRLTSQWYRENGLL